jgi:hypothetical protein
LRTKRLSSAVIIPETDGLRKVRWSRAEIPALAFVPNILCVTNQIHFLDELRGATVPMGSQEITQAIVAVDGKNARDRKLITDAARPRLYVF